MTQVFYNKADVTDAVYGLVSVYDTQEDQADVAEPGIGVLNEAEIGNITEMGTTEDGLSALQGTLQPFGYSLVVSKDNAGNFFVKPEMDCPNSQRYIPDSVFEMGSEDGQRDERPVHTVGVSGFCVDETETRNAPLSAWAVTVPVETPQPRFTAIRTCITESKVVVATTEVAAKGGANQAPIDSSQTTCEVRVKDETPKTKKI